MNRRLATLGVVAAAMAAVFAVPASSIESRAGAGDGRWGQPCLRHERIVAASHREIDGVAVARGRYTFRVREATCSRAVSLFHRWVKSGRSGPNHRVVAVHNGRVIQAGRSGGNWGFRAQRHPVPASDFVSEEFVSAISFHNPTGRRFILEEVTPGSDSFTFAKPRTMVIEPRSDFTISVGLHGYANETFPVWNSYLYNGAGRSSYLAQDGRLSLFLSFEVVQSGGGSRVQVDMTMLNRKTRDRATGSGETGQVIYDPRDDSFRLAPSDRIDLPRPAGTGQPRAGGEPLQ